MKFKIFNLIIFVQLIVILIKLINKFRLNLQNKQIKKINYVSKFKINLYIYQI
jgi:hypothetical protein